MERQETLPAFDSGPVSLTLTSGHENHSGSEVADQRSSTRTAIERRSLAASADQI
jgi:hypothetical protein